MAQSSTSDFFSFLSDKDLQTVLFNHWQALRRSERYQRAAQECLRNLQALYDQWVTEQQALNPPLLSENAAVLARELENILRDLARSVSVASPPPGRNEKYLLLLEMFLDNNAVLRTFPLEALRAIMLELVTYWDWEDQHDCLNSYIAAYTRLMDTLACATHVFCSWDPSLDSLQGEPSKRSEPASLTLTDFRSLCSDIYQPLTPCGPPSALLQLFPPLATLRLQYGLLLPLDHRIPQLPLRAAIGVFPDMVPYMPARAYTKTKPRVQNNLTYSSKVSRTLVHSEVERRLPPATSRLLTLDRYCKAFQVYDLKQESNRNGEKRSWVDIGREVFPERFKKIEHPFDKTNKKYRKLEGQIKALYANAKKLIDTA